MPSCANLNTRTNRNAASTTPHTVDAHARVHVDGGSDSDTTAVEEAHLHEEGHVAEHDCAVVGHDGQDDVGDDDDGRSEENDNAETPKAKKTAQNAQS